MRNCGDAQGLRDSPGILIPVRYDWSTARSRSSRLNIYFNSSKVRLEQALLYEPLKRMCDFNSSKVRLEPEYGVRPADAILDISIPVRYDWNPTQFSEQQAPHEFQFQ